MRSALTRTVRDSGGSPAIEYAMVAFFISIAGFGAIVALGGDVSSLFSKIAAGF